MKLLLMVAVAGIGGYLLFRLLVHLGRPRYLQEAFSELDDQYARVLRLVESDLDSAIEDYDGARSAGPAFPAAETARLERVNRARKARDREREINDKFLRLRIRFPNDFKRQAEAVAAYRAYLRFRLYQEEFAATAARDGSVAGRSQEERLAYDQERYEEARRILIALEESEKKLEALLVP